MAERWIGVALVASMLASVGLVVLYVLGGQPQLEGILLAVALGALGAAIVAWAHALLDDPAQVEEWHELGSDVEQRRVAAEILGSGDITRRGFLLRLMGGSVAFLAAALAIPVFSLGPQPGRTLFRTPWAGGARVVDGDGLPVRLEDLALNTVRTVFPEGHVGAADAATLLVRVRPSDLELDPERAGWAPEGVVGYSKICTHAGCPVGLYRAEDQSLVCPCHQSTFDVLRGAVPTFGPAARALPQLPLAVGDDGVLRATADFPEPTGPSFWNLTHEPPEDGGDEEGEE